MADKTKTTTIDRALTDKHLLGAALGDPQSWTAWLIVLKAAFGVPLTELELTFFKLVTGDRLPPTKRVRELWCLISRRCGKSRMAAAILVFLALFRRHKLSPGERGVVLCLAISEEQARVVFTYCKAFLTQSQVLKQEIISATRNEIRLKNGITIAIHANSFRTVRGMTLVGCVFDELAYWRSEESATPDIECYSAIIPALLTTNGMLVGISSPYRRAGLLHQKWKRHFGQPSEDTLVVHGTYKIFHPDLDEAGIAAQREADPTGSRSEWDGEFRDDKATFLDDRFIDVAVDRDRPIELPPRSAYMYKCFVDASGGAVAGDFYTLAIGHKQDGRFIVDVVRGIQGPFDPQLVTAEYAKLVQEYGLGAVIGDHYAAQWVESAWRRENVVYVQSELTASQLYLEALPLFSRGLVSLPDHPVLLRELRLLERTPGKNGKDAVGHPRGVHDDHACSTCGCLRTLSDMCGYNLNAMIDGFDDELQGERFKHPTYTPENPSDRVKRFKQYVMSFEGMRMGGWPPY